MEKELLNLPEHLISPPFLWGSRLRVVLYESLFVVLFCFFCWSLYSLSLIGLFRIISIPSKYYYFRPPHHVISMELLALNFRCQCTQQKLQSICAVLTFDPQLKKILAFSVNKGNNKITELRAILQRESQNS